MKHKVSFVVMLVLGLCAGAAFASPPKTAVKAKKFSKILRWKNKAVLRSARNLLGQITLLNVRIRRQKMKVSAIQKLLTRELKLRRRHRGRTFRPAKINQMKKAYQREFKRFNGMAGKLYKMLRVFRYQLKRFPGLRGVLKKTSKGTVAATLARLPQVEKRGRGIYQYKG
ncbi:MAG: hypothetical protein CL920_24705 [Deltaproteobacteria bacterium]|nr:hypothetical protein [Deltaproteobacteria bacterium]|tara:strand:+ start:568 stop:1077 length:510 start_codon:yes stop_codon:yes gene_type:complete